MNKKILIILIAVVVILLISKIIIDWQNAPKHMTPSPAQTQIYKDPRGYYTLQVPVSWIKREAPAIGKTGIGTPHETTQNIEIVQIYSQERVGVSMQVYEGSPDCAKVKPTNTTFAGLPATYDESRHLWIIPTGDATYVVSYHYPGLRQPGGQRKKMTIQPSLQEMQANHQVINNILKTINLTHMQPLHC